MKKFLAAALVFIIAAGMLTGGIHIIHALTFDRITEYVEVNFYSRRLPVYLEGYRIAFIADTHEIRSDKLWEVVDRLNTMDIDLLLLGGDINANRMTARRIISVLSNIEAPDGVFGVEGNHDSPADLFTIMEEYGMTLLINSGAHVRDGLFVGGVADSHQGRSSDIAKAITDAGADDFVILLSHRPDVAMQQDTAGTDLILAGHTHGGQMTFFGLWAPYFAINNSITDYGQRFRSGWAYSRDGVPVFVTNGVGQYFPRVFARPQVVVFTLRSY